MLAARPRILVLDDEAYRITLIEEVMAPALVYGTDFVPDFVQQAQHGGWNMMFLDYDLAADPSAPTGADAAASIGDPSGHRGGFFRRCGPGRGSWCGCPFTGWPRCRLGSEHCSELCFCQPFQRAASRRRS